MSALTPAEFEKQFQIETHFLTFLTDFVQNPRFDIIPLFTTLCEVGRDKTFASLNRFVTEIEMENRAGKRLLNIATKVDSIAIPIWLVLNGADLSHRDVDGNTVFHDAAFYGSMRVLNALLHMEKERGLTVSNQPNQAGVTPLHLASEKSWAMCELFLARGSDPYQITNDGDTVFTLSTNTNAVEVVEGWLQFFSKEPEHKFKEVLHKMTAEDKNALQYARDGNYNEIVELLEGAGMKRRRRKPRPTNTESSSPLSSRRIPGANEAKQLTLYSRFAPIGRASPMGSSDFATDAPQPGIIKNFNEACRIGNETTVSRLIELGFDCRSVRDLRGRSPLHDAVEGGFLPIVSLLVKNGADTRLEDCEGNKPIDLLKSGTKESKAISDRLIRPIIYSYFFEFLKEGNVDEARGKFELVKGMDFNVLDDKGYAAIHYAIMAADPFWVGHLIAAKADHTLKTREGDSPIVLVCKGNESGERIEILKLLLEQGVDREDSTNAAKALRERDSGGGSKFKTLVMNPRGSPKPGARRNVGLLMSEVLTNPRFSRIDKGRMCDRLRLEADLENHYQWLYDNNPKARQGYERDYSRYGAALKQFNPAFQTSLQEPLKPTILEGDLVRFTSGLSAGSPHSFVNNEMGVELRTHLNGFYRSVMACAQALADKHFEVEKNVLDQAQIDYPIYAKKVYFEAIDEGDFNRARYFVESKHHPEIAISLVTSVEGDEMNGLHISAMKGHNKLFSWFLAKGDDSLIDQLTKKGKSLSELAIEARAPLSLLLLDYAAHKKGRELSLQDSYSLCDARGNTALHLACMRGCVNELPFILESLPWACDAKNEADETPMEALEKQLERQKDNEELSSRLRRCKRIMEAE